MLGVLSSQRLTLGVLFPHKPMNMTGQLSKTLQRAGKADQEDASHLGLAQLSSIHLHPRGLTYGNSCTRSGGLAKSLPIVDVKGSSRLCLQIVLARHRHRPSPYSSAFLLPALSN